MLKAGFSKVSITPPLGTRMMGFGSRDSLSGCTAIHDPIYVRATCLKDEGRTVLILSYDICFLGREETDRFKGAIGRCLDLAPSTILMNTSHSHSGTAVGPWCYGDLWPMDKLYLEELERATVAAALTAFESSCPALMEVGVGRSSVPLNRRREEDGVVFNAPNPGGVVCDLLPVICLRTPSGEPISVLFSVSCHPSILADHSISAEFPGVAMDCLASTLGADVAQFLQGAGGDAKPVAMYDGESSRWGKGVWDMVRTTGETLAGEVASVIDAGMCVCEPSLRMASTEMRWELQSCPSPSEFQAVVDCGAGDWREHWARKHLQRLERGQQLPTHVPITLHVVQLAEGVRLVGVEGELVAEHGLSIVAAFDGGITIPMGYCNGTGLYLITSEMVDEGGMEFSSYAEYTWPAPLAKGMETELAGGLDRLQQKLA